MKVVIDLVTNQSSFNKTTSIPLNDCKGLLSKFDQAEVK